MKASIIDGKALAQRHSESLKQRVCALRALGVTPKLAVVLVGDNPASASYVRGKVKRAQELCIDIDVIKRDSSVSEHEIVEIIEALNCDSSVHGIIVQLPLPESFDEQGILLKVSPDKDVDGIHPFSAGALISGRDGFVACTPKGVIELIKSTGTDIDGKRAVVVGRSNLVGKPAAVMLMNNNATVTVCHSHTRNLGEITRSADILVCAVGHYKLITADMIKPGAIVIDVGMNRIDDRWYGDVDFENALNIASFITPVPGGVGPMTIMMLMDNTVEAAQRSLHV